MNNNILLRTDIYKMNHMEMYCPGTTKVYSYLTARSSKNFNKCVFFGLQYFLKEYLAKPITKEMADEFLEVREYILGEPASEDIKNKIYSLADLGYWPLEIKSVPEGSVIPVRNALMTITNTKPEFYWCVGFVESLLLKLWYTSTVATQCYHYREVVEDYFKQTVDDEQNFLKDFMVHDFGYRGDSSEEGAGISGVAHLINFTGSDTVPAFNTAINYYNASPIGLMASVPASEHSVMCSYGRSDELAAFRQMLKLYPKGIVSIVSDTFNVWNVLTNFCESLKSDILGRDGKTVFRPDSGNPEYIICGNPNADEGSLEWKGAVRLLDEKFGHTVNSKGYKVLNPKVGLIYGDGMYLERYKRTLERLKEMGYAASNLVIGVGGILRNHSRDTLGFAIKATYVECNGEHREIEKDPITDPGKKSLKGLLALKIEDDKYVTYDQVSEEDEKWSSILSPVFKDGKIMREEYMSDIRKRVRNTYGR